MNNVISFVEEVMFNERLSAEKGFLQGIEPRLKIVTLFLLILSLSFQRSPVGIAFFAVIGGILVFVSKVPPLSFIKRLLPAAIITSVIAMPAMFNIVVPGEPLVVLHRFGGPVSLGPVALPDELAITEQGVRSASTLFLRVASSVSFVFLLTMTTPPNKLIKGLSSFMPGFFGSVVSISYRYIFFLLRKVEQSVMGLKSRRVSQLSPVKGRHWAASRIGLLFLISMELSSELGTAMESRGYKGESLKVQTSKFKVSDFSLRDTLWLSFTILFCGVMTWISFR